MRSNVKKIEKTQIRVGILALQGSFAEHAAVFKKLGCDVAEIRSVEAALSFRPNALAMPGGESTAMMRLFRNQYAD